LVLLRSVKVGAVMQPTVTRKLSVAHCVFVYCGSDSRNNNASAMESTGTTTETDDTTTRTTGCPRSIPRTTTTLEAAAATAPPPLPPQVQYCNSLYCRESTGGGLFRSILCVDDAVSWEENFVVLDTIRNSNNKYVNDRGCEYDLAEWVEGMYA
jgi:hypothetical protein